MTDSKDKLLQAYNRMVDELSAAVEKAEETLSPTIDEMLKNSEELTKKAFALTQDEAKNISAYLKREITDAREYMHTDGREYRQWLNFDIQQVEDQFIDFLSKAADKTWIDFKALEILSEKNSLYHTGEICSAGTLSCQNCGQQMKFTKNTRIPPCPKCHKTTFKRVVS